MSRAAQDRATISFCGLSFPHAALAARLEVGFLLVQEGVVLSDDAPALGLVGLALLVPLLPQEGRIPAQLPHRAPLLAIHLLLQPLLLRPLPVQGMAKWSPTACFDGELWIEIF